MRLGVYIGSFNPVHNGHINLVNYLLEENYVDRVLIVPTIGYWDKRNLVDINHRINMLKFFENDNILVDINHNNYEFTCELMDSLKEDIVDDLYLIMGADNIINFDKWKNYQDLLKYNIIIVNRDNINIDDYTKNYNTSNFIICRDYKPLNISSTFIRGNLDDKYLDKRVYNYIKENNLY